MLRTWWCLLLAVTTLSAADISGKWSGNIRTPDGGTQSAYLELRQSGEALTGTAGPAAEKQMPIQNGKVQGNKASFEVALPSGGVMKFAVTCEGDRIEGDIWHEKDGDREDPSKLSVTRVT